MLVLFLSWLSIKEKTKYCKFQTKDWNLETKKFSQVAGNVDWQNIIFGWSSPISDW